MYRRCIGVYRSVSGTTLCWCLPAAPAGILPTQYVGLYRSICFTGVSEMYLSVYRMYHVSLVPIGKSVSRIWRRGYIGYRSQFWIHITSSDTDWIQIKIQLYVSECISVYQSVSGFSVSPLSSGVTCLYQRVSSCIRQFFHVSAVSHNALIQL